MKRTVKPEIKEGYRAWFGCVKRSDIYSSVAEKMGKEGPPAVVALFHDFGDVRSLTFDDWWKQTGLAVATGVPETKTLVDYQVSEKSYNTEALLKDATSGSYFLLLIPVTADGDDVKHDWNSAQNVVARLKQTQALPHRKLKKRSLRILNKWLEVWDMRKAHPDMSTLDIARSTGLYDEANPRNSQLVVGRYLRLADELIRNAALGRFVEVSKY